MKDDDLLETGYLIASGALMALDDVGLLDPHARALIVDAVQTVTGKPLLLTTFTAIRNREASLAAITLARGVLHSYCVKGLEELDEAGVEVDVDRSILDGLATYRDLLEVMKSLRRAIAEYQCGCPTCQEKRGEVNREKAIAFFVGEGENRRDAAERADEWLSRPKPLTEEEIERLCKQHGVE